MILTWNVNPYLNLTREIRQRQKSDNDVISVKCDVIVTFALYFQFGAIQKHDPDAGFEIENILDSESKEFLMHGL